MMTQTDINHLGKMECLLRSKSFLCYRRFLKAVGGKEKRWTQGTHHDCHDFLTSLLDTLQVIDWC